jgi:hypothetical protein
MAAHGQSAIQVHCSIGALHCIALHCIGARDRHPRATAMHGSTWPDYWHPYAATTGLAVFTPVHLSASCVLTSQALPPTQLFLLGMLTPTYFASCSSLAGQTLVDSARHMLDPVAPTSLGTRWLHAADVSPTQLSNLLRPWPAPISLWAYDFPFQSALRSSCTSIFTPRLVADYSGRILKPSRNFSSRRI